MNSFFFTIFVERNEKFIIQKLRMKANYLLFSLCCLVITSCTNKPHDNLEEKGRLLILQMQRLADNKSYIEYSSHSKEINKTIEDMAQQKYDEPRKIFIIDHLRIDNLLNLNQQKETKELISNRYLKAIPTLLNSQIGSNQLAATSLVTVEDVFHYEGLKEYTLYLYLYKGKYHSIVLFRPAKEDIVLANAYFVSHPLLNNIKSTDEVAVFFKKALNISEVHVTETYSNQTKTLKQD